MGSRHLVPIGRSSRSSRSALPLKVPK
jgi:hypothetical protein